MDPRPSALSGQGQSRELGGSTVLIADETCAVVIFLVAIFGCAAKNPRIDRVNASILLLLTRERERLRLMQLAGMIIIGYFRG